MCYDARSSMVAWMAANAIALFLWNRNKNYDRWNAAFIATFTLIQLAEFGLWKSDLKMPTNSKITALIIVLLALQPLVQNYMGYSFTKNKHLKYTFYMFFALFIWAIYRSITGNFESVRGETGHLVWSGKDTLFGNEMFTMLYLLGLGLPLLYMKNKKGLPLIILGIITAAYSYYTSRGKEFGSMWCYTSVVYAFVALFL